MVLRGGGDGLVARRLVWSVLRGDRGVVAGAGEQWWGVFAMWCQPREAASRTARRRAGLAGRPEPPEPDDRSRALPRGRRAAGRRAQQDHEPPGPVDDRQSALQREGAKDAARAPGLARASQPGQHPTLCEDQADHLV